MARVNITVPDDVLAGARAADLKVSGLATRALKAELARRAKLAEFEAVMAEIEAEVAEPDAEQTAVTERWVDDLLDEAERLRHGS